MFKDLVKYKKQIDAIFATHKIEKAYIFGSAATDQLRKDSDLDFLVQFEPNLAPLERGELWWELHDKLRDFFNREIDIVTEKSLKNPYFIEELEQTKRLIYGA